MRKPFGAVFYSVWAISLILVIFSAKKAGIWQGDMYFNGMSAGVFVMLTMDKIMDYLGASAEQMRRRARELEAEAIEIEAEGKRLLWRINGLKRRWRK